MDTLHLNQARPPAGHVGLEHILSQLRIAAYKHHICTADFFRDHDHLRSGIITRTQFERGLHFFLGRVTKLDSQDINMLTEAFSTSDGRVRYRDYCNAVENAFDGRHLEKAPMDSVICPSREELTTANQAKILTPKEEEEVDHILSRLAVIIRQRRLDAGPYFKDFEQSTAETHIITRTQFSRILHFLGLHVTSDELHLVCDKFVVGSNFVNYLLFVKAVEPGALGCRKRDSTKAAKVIKGTKSEQVTAQTSGIVDPNKFRIHLQKYLEVYGVRLQEFIRDFDPLRSGSVSTSVLRRAISMAGLRPEPSQAVFDAFASCYKDLRQPGYIRYNEMLAHLQLPIDNLGLRNGFHMPVPQHRHAEDLQEDQQGVLEKVLRHFKNTILQRRLNVEPLFREFDRHYKGCVSEFRLQQIISQLSVRVSEADVAVLLAAFPGGTTMTPQSVDNVFNYRTFLERLESMDKRPSPYQERTDRCSTGMRRETSPNRNRRPHCSSVQDPPRCDVQL